MSSLFLPLPTVSVTAIPAVFSGLSPIFPQKLMTGSWNESWLCSNFSFPPGDREFCHYGIEGVDYRNTEDGYQCLLDTGSESLTTTLSRKYPSDILFSGIATWGGGWEDFEENGMNELRYGGACVRLARKSALWYRDNTTQLERPYAFLIYQKNPPSSSVPPRPLMPL